ncbi:hypothetical protein Scep_002450 [Stephania cephalantha]|uniref:Uncharacterized protein n=1 Tax=Stephania cephalantha TaxID=152367 RepID=A0AAP0Q5Y7_9MAGN
MQLNVCDLYRWYPLPETKLAHDSIGMIHFDYTEKNQRCSRSPNSTTTATIRR